MLPNDEKTRTFSAVSPNDTSWPLELQRLSGLCLAEDDLSEDSIIELVDATLRATKTFKTQSPLKLVLRSIDKCNLDLRDEFSALEPFLLRFVYHFSHTIDYIAMILGSRVLHGHPIDTDSWTNVINDSVIRYSRLGHHHEVAWLVWLSMMAGITLADKSLEEIIRTRNGHLLAMLIGVLDEGLIPKLPDLEFDSKLDMRSADWLYFHEANPSYSPDGA